MIRILKRLFRLMSHYKGRLYLGIALSMISNITRRFKRTFHLAVN